MVELRNERELEDYIYHELSNREISDENICDFISGIPQRQFQITGYGVIDLITFDVSPGDHKPLLTIEIIELKKNEIDYNAIGQISRYKTAIERSIQSINKFYKHFEVEIKGFLIGSHIGNGDVRYVLDNMKWITTLSYELTLQEGISFQDHIGWYRPDEDFTNIYSKLLDLFNERIGKNYKNWMSHCDVNRYTKRLSLGLIKRS